MGKEQSIEIIGNDISAIRESQNDFITLFKLINYSSHKKLSSDNYYLDYYNKMKDYVSLGKGHVLMAKNEENFMGFIWFFFHDEVTHINQFAIFPEFSGNGIGTKLLDEVIKLSLKKNIVSIELHVSEKNIKAQKMYGNNGFTQKSKIIDQDSVRFLLEKRLKITIK